MRIFISAGEPSGDLHGANLARSLRAVMPNVELFGLGGSKMSDAGVDLFYPLADHAVMGFVRVVQVIPTMWRLLQRLLREFEKRRPDALVLIDYPGFHWHLAAKAKAMGIPVISFVPPQIWGWASHRVSRVRKNFEYVLCALPFEPRWYHDRGVINARYIGHPYFDELPRQKLDATFMAEQRRAGTPIVALMPGSRGHEVKHNLPTLLNTAHRIHAERPDVRFLFPCFKEQHRDYVASRVLASIPAEVLVHRTAETIELADSCVAVSGSVGLELLYRCKPTVVIYRINRFFRFVTWLCKNVPYISLVNLLAEKELYPEFLLDHDDSPGPAAHVLRWLNDRQQHEEVVGALAELKGRVAAPGACDRAAEFLVERFGRRRAAA
ncbi:MAG: lipid-A-disaccharide synthase [Gemmataceae bacterium]